MWDLPGPGLEPMSPALAGGFLTTVPPGKPPETYLTLFKANRDVAFLTHLSLLNKIYIPYLNEWLDDLYYIHVMDEIISSHSN